MLFIAFCGVNCLKISHSDPLSAKKWELWEKGHRESLTLKPYERKDTENSSAEWDITIPFLTWSDNVRLHKTTLVTCDIIGDMI
jgi:hypothetical protein